MAALVILSAVLFGLLQPFSMADNKNILFGGNTLNADDSLTEGDFTFTMKSDCNLVLSDKDGKERWSSDTANKDRNCVANFQTNGDLVIKNSVTDDTVWSSNTPDEEGIYIITSSS